MKKVPFAPQLLALCATALLAGLTGFAPSANAQTITLPPNGDNQRSEVTQYIGAIANIHVRYNSPNVTGPNGEDRRGNIWGDVVPYGLTDLGFGMGPTSPWRAGANENTVITLSHDMQVEGKLLPAGAYGFHLIPQENGPWTAIFNKNSEAWGSYAYSASEDALRVNVSPRAHEHTEWLTYDFIDRQPNAALLAMRWEAIEVPIRFEVPDITDLYLQQIRRDLSGGNGFAWQAHEQAAQFCLHNKTNLEEALVWAENAVSMPFIGEANFTTLKTKADVLQALGRSDEAKAALNKAIEHPSAQAGAIHQYGRQLLSRGEKDEALRIFTYNHERYKGAWPTHVGMMRGLSATGDYKNALKHAKLALEQAPDPLNKSSLEQAIKKLENNQDVN
ncbi:MAG: DUF2911 domain-containing protein [Bacteroidetes bacterium]|nr:DUF2911 domain-containing protein [Bacteroidota bacterium]